MNTALVPVQEEGIPLRVDRAALAAKNRRSTMRCISAIALGALKGQSADSIVAENWSDDAVAAVLTRAATTPIDTTTSGLPLLAPVRIVPSIAPSSAAVKLFGQAGVKLDFAGVDHYSIPFLSSMPEPVWVRPSGAIPVVDAVLDGTIIGPTRKLAFIVPITGELNNYSVEAAHEVISRMMTDTARFALDRAAFSNIAGDAVRAPGLLYGATPFTATAGGGLTALVADLKNLVGAIAAAKIDTEGAIIITHPQQRETLQTLPPQPVPHAIYTTIAVPVGFVAMIAPESVASGYDGSAQIYTSKDASANYEDTAPLAIVGPDGTVAAPTISAFQTDQLLLKLIVRCAWGVRLGGAQYISAVTW
jgi:hypothetical protein